MEGTVPSMKVYLVGMGMGDPDLLTVGAVRALEESALVVGARRLLDSLADIPSVDPSSKTLVDAVRASDIEKVLRGSDAEVACVVFSGDLGFFSGSVLLTGRLEGMEVVTIPGISSMSFFSSRVQIPYSDIEVVSVHGRDDNVVGAVATSRRTFLITGGDTRVHDVCRRLAEHGLGDVVVHTGERLSYPDERIVSGSAAELAEMEFADLSVMIVENPSPLQRPYANVGLSDSMFERGDAPMTKEEVRELSISKMHLRQDSVVWDVGAGTGSVTVECALAACKGEVYAIERNAGALEVLRANIERFGLRNVRVVEGEAPGVLEGLPVPDVVFIGGSGGNMAAIVDAALSSNPSARVVVNAITLETLSEIMLCTKDIGVDPDVVHVSVSRSTKVGPYHMMRGENPIYIVSFGGDGEMR